MNCWVVGAIDNDPLSTKSKTGAEVGGIGSLHPSVDALGQFLDPAHILVAEFPVDMAVVHVLKVPVKRSDDAR